MLTRFKGLNLLAKIIVAIGAMIIILALSLGLFTLGYWLTTIIFFHFFDFVLPFTSNYVIGSWLLLLIFYAFILPSGIKINLK